MFAQFEHSIRALPPRARYEHSDLLIPELLIGREKAISMYYAPLDWTNTSARVILLGITPGWTQMELAYHGAVAAIAEHKPAAEICRAAKTTGAFAGPIRGNLVRMLDELGIHHVLGLSSSADLFGIARPFLHTTSAIRYPVFLGTRNYTGSNPSPENSPLLMRFAHEVLAPELESVKNALIVPLGKSVERVLDVLAAAGDIRSNRWLRGFPHPSGANGHRVRIFNQNRRSLAQQMNRIFTEVSPAG